MILGIETSCDETALALVSGRSLIAHRMASQQAHSLFGGVVPEIASREHLRLLDPLLADLLAEAGVALGEVKAIAASRGPGLLGSLLVGLSFAKGLSLGLGAPIIGVNHLHAHLLSPLLQGKMEFPALGLIVSGGHTQLVLMRSETSFELLGRTLDDAAGEAFDKLARALNFPYPGGRYIDELARESEPDKDMFPRPYIDNDNLDFSFSGLKTAAANHLRKSPELRAAGMSDPTELPHGEKRKELARLCASFNWSVAGSLRIKLKRALSAAGEVKTIVAAGGVAANSMIREMLSEVADEAGLAPALPEPWLCTDNAAMIALAGEVLLEHGLVHGPDVDAVPRGRDVPWDYLPYGGQVRA